MARLVSVWLPNLATDILLRRNPAWRDRPLATFAEGRSQRLVAVGRIARQTGLRPGMMASAARALLPELILVPADPVGDRRILAALAERVSAYSPWTAPEDDLAAAGVEMRGAGLWLDIAGCDHLFGGEAALLDKLSTELAGLGLAVRAAIADTAGAAWAWARFGRREESILASGAESEAIAPLPLAALRLPARQVAALSALGFRQIGELMALPRASLAARFGREPSRRLDQALGREPEPITPLRPPAPHRIRIAFPEPIGRAEDVAEATRRLLGHLCERLEKEGLGLRRLALLAFRADGSLTELAAGTGEPSHDPVHLFRLIEEKLGSLDAGFGIEAMRLDAPEVAEMTPRQGDLAGGVAGDENFSRLLDAIANRLGAERVMRLAPRESHLPERAVRRQPPAETLISDNIWPIARRPIMLLDRPEPVEATAPLPDSPPLQFRWRKHLHMVIQADGPERISCEWWRDSRPDRDYYQVEDNEGRRFWMFREGHAGDGGGHWFIHGMFA